jgi:hypothetical protein
MRSPDVVVCAIEEATEIDCIADSQKTSTASPIHDRSRQMAEEETNEEQTEEQTEQEKRESGGQKIMCFVSKEMVPINQTVELEYMPGKKVRVMPEFIKYDFEQEEA